MQRLATRLPLAELWDDAGPVAATRLRGLTTADIRELLRAGPVRFVVADVGHPLRWIPVGDRFRFWKEEVKPRVAKAPRWRLEDFPGEYCYSASEWTSAEGPPVVVPPP
jgi:hypothetical protein